MCTNIRGQLLKVLATENKACLKSPPQVWVSMWIVFKIHAEIMWFKIIAGELSFQMVLGLRWKGQHSPLSKIGQRYPSSLTLLWSKAFLLNLIFNSTKNKTQYKIIEICILRSERPMPRLEIKCTNRVRVKYLVHLLKGSLRRKRLWWSIWKNQALQIETHSVHLGQVLIVQACKAQKE